MFRRTFNSGLAATVLCASVLLSACGGGGGSGSSGSSASSASSGGDATTLKAGLYVADVKYVNGAPSQKAVTYLSPTGTFAIIFGGGAGLSFGTLAFDSSNISGTSIDYRQLVSDQPNSEGFVEDRSVFEGAISGTISSLESGSFSTVDPAGKVNTNVTLKRQNSLSDLGISLKRVAGTYVKGESEVALTFGEDGSSFAQYYTQTTGCQLGGPGTLSVPVASINVFDISYTMSNCTNESRNGEYSGIGFFGPTADQRMQVVFAAHNGNVAMKFEGIN